MVLGKQGAGKGTQCVRLSHHYVVPHVSTGDMLRGEVKSRTPLGLRAKEQMDSGDLIADDLIMEMVGRRLSEGDTRARGFVLDGCPRTISQASDLAARLLPDHLDLVIDLEVPTPLVLRRLASRRVCVDCGANYSVSSPPLSNWTCDVCGGEVVQRPDDTEDAIRRRLDLYERQTAPLIEWYRHQDLLASVNGTGAPDVVTRRCVKAIESRRSGGPPSKPPGKSGRPAEPGSEDR
ncbi:MAG: adenylate kinase family protein [Acidimicrobiales bacterium]